MIFFFCTGLSATGTQIRRLPIEEYGKGPSVLVGLDGIGAGIGARIVVFLDFIPLPNSLPKGFFLFFMCIFLV